MPSINICSTFPIRCGYAEDDELSDVSVLDTSIQTEDQSTGDLAADNASSTSPHRQPQCSRQQPDRDARRCRSLSRNRDRQGHSPTRAADDLDVIDGVQPLAAADAAAPAEHGVGIFGHSSLSLSMDSVSGGGHKRKAVATLPGNEQKSHRKSL